MHNISVQNQHLGQKIGKQYDITILLLMHYSDKYKARLEAFKTAGLYNINKHSIHLVLAASPGDWSNREKILRGWPEALDITLLEMGSSHPIPKVNGYYLWLKANQFTSNWYLRIDDDSVTDVAAFADYADSHYQSSPVHLMTHPLFFPSAIHKFVSYLLDHKISIPTISHEHESSLTSRSAMQTVFNCKAATDFLIHAGMHHTQFGDQTLALAMHIAQVPVAVNPISSRDHLVDQLNLTGGSFAHIHYVDWQNTDFTTQLNAALHGTRTPITLEFVRSLWGHSLEFGRSFGVHLTNLILDPDGTILGRTHENESRWRFTDGILTLQRPSRLNTTIFHSILHHENNAWLVGPCLYHPCQHYLRVNSKHFSG